MAENPDNDPLSTIMSAFEIVKIQIDEIKQRLAAHERGTKIVSVEQLTELVELLVPSMQNLNERFDVISELVRPILTNDLPLIQERMNAVAMILGLSYQESETSSSASSPTLDRLFSTLAQSQQENDALREEINFLRSDVLARLTRQERAQRIMQRDQWKINKAQPNSEEITDSFSKYGMNLVLRSNGIDIFDTVHVSTSLFSSSTWRKPELERMRCWDFIPKSATLAFLNWAHQRQCNIFNFKKGIVVHQFELNEFITNIYCSEKAILLANDTNLYLYSWNGQTESQVLKEKQCSASSMSATGVAVYQLKRENRLLHFFDTTTQQKPPTIAVDFAFNAIFINSAGTIAGAYQNQEHLTLFKISTRQLIFNRDTHGFGYIWRNPISENDRFFFFIGRSVKKQKDEATIMVLDYDREGDGVATFKFSYVFEIELFRWESAAFREINGEMHFQVVTEAGCLKVYRIDEEEETVTLVE